MRQPAWRRLGVPVRGPRADLFSRPGDVPVDIANLALPVGDGDRLEGAGPFRREVNNPLAGSLPISFAGIRNMMTTVRPAYPRACLQLAWLQPTTPDRVAGATSGRAASAHR